MRYQGHLRPERCCASSLPPTLPPPLFFPPPSSLFPFLPNPPLLPLPFPQWQHPAPTNPSLDHHPHPHPLLNQSHQTRNKPPGTAMKCLRPFYLSRSPYPHLPPPSPAPSISPRLSSLTSRVFLPLPMQVQHIPLGLLQKARLSQCRKPTCRRGRPSSRI